MRRERVRSLSFFLLILVSDRIHLKLFRPDSDSHTLIFLAVSELLGLCQKIHQVVVGQPIEEGELVASHPLPSLSFLAPADLFFTFDRLSG